MANSKIVISGFDFYFAFSWAICLATYPVFNSIRSELLDIHISGEDIESCPIVEGVFHKYMVFLARCEKAWLEVMTEI